MLHIIPIDKIQVPESRLNSQLDPDGVRALENSISQWGLMNPVHVQAQNGEYLLIAGLNRVIAHRNLGKNTIPAFVYQPEETPVDILNITENLHRGSTNPIEEAEQINQLIQRTNSTTEQAAIMLGRTENWIRARLGLLSLPRDIRDDIQTKRLTIAAGTQLAYISDVCLRRQLATKAIDYGASSNTIKTWVDTITQAGIPKQILDATQGSHNLPDTPTPILLTCFACTFDHQPHLVQAVLICDDCRKLLQPDAGSDSVDSAPEPSTK